MSAMELETLNAQNIAGFSLSLWERVGVRVRLLPNVAEILEA